MEIKAPLATAASPRRRIAVLCALTLVAGAWFLLPRGQPEARPTPRPVAEALGLEQVELSLTPDDLEALRATRAEAIHNRTLYGVENPFLPATLRLDDGRALRVEVRLKGGGAVDHLGGDKWSLRVRVKGGDAAFGMEAFSLMDPARRGYGMEWLARALIRSEGLIAKRYRFVELTLGGRLLGLYAVDEHYGEPMLTANERRLGPIVRLSQEALWDEGAAFALGAQQRDDYYFSAPVEPIGEEGSPPEVVERARARFEAFRRGELATHEVFDPSFATWLALGDLLGAWHGFGSFNLKFYFNPLSELLEPVPDDTFNENAAVEIRQLMLDDHPVEGRFLRQVFADLEFTARYLSELERVSSAGYLEQRLRPVAAEVQRQERILNLELPGYALPLSDLRENQGRIRKILAPQQALAAHLLSADPERIELELGALKALPVEVLALEESAGRRWTPAGEARVRGKPARSAVVLRPLSFSPDEPSGALPLDVRGLTVHYRVLGTSRERSAQVDPWHPGPGSGARAFVEPTAASFSFVRVDPETGALEVAPGSWTVDRPLVVGAGTPLTLRAGTTLDLVQGGAIVSRSPVQLLGTSAAPVRVVSSDGAGAGLVVLDAGGPSTLEHVELVGLSPLARDGWAPTGAVTFFRSPVTLRDCRLQGTRGEDALNVVQCGFRLERTVLADSASDALDVDFGVGELVDVSFEGSGNDALDISGTRLRATRLTIADAGDKAVSCGEASELELEGVRIRDSRIGIASKDLSLTRARDLRLERCAIGLAAFCKKPSFGPGTLGVEEATLVDVETPFLVERGSVVARDGRPLPAEEERVAERLYPDR